MDSILGLSDKEYEEYLLKSVEILQIQPKRRSPEEVNILQRCMIKIQFFQKVVLNSGFETFKQAINCIGYQKLQAKEVLFHANTKGDRFYIILTGSVGIYILLPSEEPGKHAIKKVNTLGRGLAFGEIALMDDNALRTATIIANDEGCDLAFMSKQDYRNILGMREAQLLKEKLLYLYKYPFFKGWAHREVKTFSYHFKLQHYKRGDIIYNIGDSCENMYFVKDGEFLMSINYNEKLDTKTDFMAEKTLSRPLSICTMQEREIFGEEKYMQHETRFAKVICNSSKGSLFIVLYEDIKKRIWDPKSKESLMAILQPAYDWRISRIQDMTKGIIDLKKSKNKRQIKDTIIQNIDTNVESESTRKSTISRNLFHQEEIPAKSSQNLQSNKQLPQQEEHVAFKPLSLQQRSKSSLETTQHKTISHAKFQDSQSYQIYMRLKKQNNLHKDKDNQKNQSQISVRSKSNQSKIREHVLSNVDQTKKATSQSPIDGMQQRHENKQTIEENQKSNLESTEQCVTIRGEQENKIHRDRYLTHYVKQQEIKQKENSKNIRLKSQMAAFTGKHYYKYESTDKNEFNLDQNIDKQFDIVYEQHQNAINKTIEIARLVNGNPYRLQSYFENKKKFKNDFLMNYFIFVEDRKSQTQLYKKLLNQAKNNFYSDLAKDKSNQKLTNNNSSLLVGQEKSIQPTQESQIAEETYNFCSSSSKIITTNNVSTTITNNNQIINTNSTEVLKSIGKIPTQPSQANENNLSNKHLQTIGDLQPTLQDQSYNKCITEEGQYQTITLKNQSSYYYLKELINQKKPNIGNIDLKQHQYRQKQQQTDQQHSIVKFFRQYTPLRQQRQDGQTRQQKTPQPQRSMKQNAIIISSSQK